MTTDTITPEQRLTVLKHLANGRDPDFVATVVRIPRDQVAAIGREHGHPDRVKLGQAVDVLTGRTPAPNNGAASPHQSEQPPALTDGDYGTVPVDQLHPSPANPRENLTGIEDLAQSMTQVGLIQPIVAQRMPDGHLQIVAGHRRHAAAKLLRWDTVPAIIRRRLLPDAELVTMLIENGQRAGLNPIEEARALRHIKATTSVDDTTLSRRIGRSQTYVSDRLRLLYLPAADQEAIRAGRMTLREARDRALTASGKNRPNSTGGKTTAAHLSINHPLGTRAKARCIRLGHPRGRGTSVGGIACGQCWESVIRADERDHLHHVSAKIGHCVLCGTEHDPDKAAS